jgi:drug/metabolite transporter (DMT)-like permease
MFAGTAARRGSVLSLTFWSQFLGFVIALPVLFVVGTSSVNGRVLALGALAGVGVAISLFFLYLSTRYLFVGVSSALSAVVACACPVLYSWLDHPLSVEAVAGVGVCLVAISVVARWRSGVPTSTVGSLLPREARGVAAALFSGLGLSVYYVCLAGTSVHAQLWEAIDSRLVSAVLLGLTALVFARRSIGASLAEIKGAAPVAVAGIIGALAYASAITSGSLAVIVPIASLSPVVTVLLGWLVLHERISRLQLVGVLLAMVGVVLLTS